MSNSGKIPVGTIEFLRDAAMHGVSSSPSVTLMLIDALERAYDDIARVPSPSAQARKDERGV